MCMCCIQVRIAAKDALPPSGRAAERKVASKSEHTESKNSIVQKLESQSGRNAFTTAAANPRAGPPVRPHGASSGCQIRWPAFATAIFPPSPDRVASPNTSPAVEKGCLAIACIVADESASLASAGCGEACKAAGKGMTLALASFKRIP
jgi:hypothetical protein